MFGKKLFLKQLCGMKFTWDLVSRIAKFFLWSAIIKSCKNKLPETKIQQKLTPFFTLLNFHEIGVTV